jgi:hypothetical protein
VLGVIITVSHGGQSADCVVKEDDKLLWPLHMDPIFIDESVIIVECFVTVEHIYHLVVLIIDEHRCVNSPANTKKVGTRHHNYNGAKNPVEVNEK